MTLSDQQRSRAIQIKALCTAFVKLVNHDIELNLRKAKIEINIGALIPLMIIQHTPITVQELSKRILVAPATLIPIIDDLEKKGLIRRQTQPLDRRKKLLCVTTKGLTLIMRILAINTNSKFSRIIDKLDETKATKLVQTLEEIVTALSDDKEICQTIAQNAKSTGKK